MRRLWALVKAVRYTAHDILRYALGNILCWWVWDARGWRAGTWAYGIWLALEIIASIVDIFIEDRRQQKAARRVGC